MTFGGGVVCFSPPLFASMDSLVSFWAGSGLIWAVWSTFGRRLPFFWTGSGIPLGGVVHFRAGSRLLLGEVWSTIGWPGVHSGGFCSTFGLLGLLHWEFRFTFGRALVSLLSA